LDKVLRKTLISLLPMIKILFRVSFPDFKMKTTTRLYILQIILIGAIILILMVLKISGEKRLNLFLKLSHANNERLVENILKMDKAVFMRPLHDNSEWDETIEYIEKPTRDFEEVNLNSLLKTYSFNHLWVFDQHMKRVYYINDSTPLNLDTLIPAYPMNRLLTPETPLCHFFINVNNNLVEIIGATIVPTVDTRHTQPASGFLFFGRDWNKEIIQHLEDLSGSRISIVKPFVHGKDTSADEHSAIFYSLSDLKNRTVIQLEFNFPNVYFNEWIKDTTVLTTIYILIGLFSILLIGFLSMRWFYIPLQAIIKTLNTGDNRHLQPVKSAKNEFGEIARLLEDSLITKEYLKAELQNKIEIEKILISLKDKAEESDRLKTAFLSNMSHEIRTPMNCILGFIQLLEQEEYTPEERHHYMSMVISSGNQLLTIINDILDLSRIESNQMILQPVHFDLNKLLEKLLIFFTNEKLKSGKDDLVIELNMGISPGSCHIFCDGVRLEQILNNLLGNALKFTNSGKITFGYTCDQDNLNFFVQDTGCGISAVNQGIIFERFRQEEESHTRKFGGTGLGLPITKGLIEMMGGKMWLISAKGEGATFSFTLPLVIGGDEILPDNVVAPVKKPLNLSGKTILVAEDIPENIELISIMLKPTHVTILRADNGLNALTMCQENFSIDLVLMDIEMPVMNGFDATREIKKIRAELPVIALTAYAFEKDKKSCEEAGCDGFLSKPILKNELFLKLSDLLGK